MKQKNEFKADPLSQWKSAGEGGLDQETINQNPAAGPCAERPQRQENSYACNQ